MKGAVATAAAAAASLLLCCPMVVVEARAAAPTRAAAGAAAARVAPVGEWSSSLSSPSSSSPSWHQQRQTEGRGQQQEEEGPAGGWVASRWGRQRGAGGALSSSSRGSTSVVMVAQQLGKVRGGAKLATKAAKKTGANNKSGKSKEAASTVKKAYLSVPLATRAQLSLVLLVTLLSFVLDPSYLILDLRSTIMGLQLWRPLTAAAFMGPPSMSWLSNTYFLVQYGQQLEQNEGTAQQVVFLLFQMLVLSLLSGVIGLPVYSNCLITASLHCCGRMDPLRQVNWMFGLKIKYWLLPFCLAAVDVLQAQNPLALLPHALGILSGHLYYFLTSVWPKMGGAELLVAPEWWARRLNRRKEEEAIFRKDRGQGGDEGADKKKKNKGGKVYKMGSGKK